MSFGVEIGFASIGAMLLLLVLRVPIGVSLGIVSFLGICLVRGPNVAIGLLKTIPFDFSAHWSLSAIPMFLLMGSIAHISGLTSSLFSCARAWLSFLPGGLAVATVFASAGFAAATGSSVASAAAMSRIAIPEMLRFNYDKGLATGVAAAGGTLGSLIPPSVLFVVFGMLAEVSISKLLIAGLLPGLLTAAIYTAMIIARCAANPSLAPASHIEFTKSERLTELWSIWPVLLLIIGVIGSIYFGITTPTEAGAVGAALATLIAIAKRRLSMSLFQAAVAEALTATGKLFFVAIGAVLFTKLMVLTGVPRFLEDIISVWQTNEIAIVLGLSIVYLILGCILDPIGLMLVTMPIFVPMFKALNLDLIWLGVLVIKYVEIGLLTPPIGFNLIIVKNAVGDRISLSQIIRGVSWFLICEILIMILLIGFPWISTWLPSLM